MSNENSLRRLSLSRRAHRGRLTTLFTAADACRTTLETMRSASNVDESSVKEQEGKLQASIGHIINKISTLEKIDNDILELTEEAKLETEITETDEYLQESREKLSILKVIVQPVVKPIPTSSTQEVSSSTNSPSRRKVNLPKLSLPTFDGNPLNWITFKESFDSAVDTDRTIDDIQKFQYLKGQLHGEASRTIEGLALSGQNYKNAIDLLTSRYGQSHKLINVYMKALMELKTPSSNLESLRNFYDSLESYIRGLESLGKKEESYGDLLVPVILERLPGALVTQITREHGNKAWTLAELREALLNEIEAGQAGHAIQQLSLYNSTPTPTAAFVTTSENFKPHCVYCKNQHSPNSCRIVTQINARRDIVQQKKLCFNCLGPHKMIECRSKFKCRRCQRKHHTSLCPGETTEPATAGGAPATRPNRTPNRQQPTQAAQVTHVKSEFNSSQFSATNLSTDVLLKTAITGVSDTHGSSIIDATILFDEGSQRSFITEDLTQQLQLRSYDQETIKLSTFGDASTGTRSLKKVEFTIRTPDMTNITIKALVVPTITSPMKNYVKEPIANLSHLQGLTLAHPVSNADTFSINILIGADYYWDIVGSHIVRGHGPTAVSSRLGYLLSGPTCRNASPNAKSAVMLIGASLNTPADVSDLWKLESIGIQPEENDNSNTFEHFRDNNLSFNANRYTAKLPWKPEHPALPTNFDACIKRTRSMISRLTPELRKTYNSIIQEQESRGFIEKVETDNNTNGHYLTHHPVKKDSQTTPIRVVYDCSYKTSLTQPSLNDCLHAGPPLLNDLVSIMIRFRLKRIAISSDIEKAFLNISLDNNDRKYTKFLWLSNPEDPKSEFTTYQFTSVLFGAVCSPFILNAVVKTHLQANPSCVSSDLSKNIYVDNVATSVDTDQDAIHYFNSATTLMDSAGFKLREWASNNQELHTLTEQHGINNPNSNTNLLGLKWNTSLDEISFPSKQYGNKPDEMTTKREIIQATASVYDPLGFLSPVIVNAKILIQDLWKSELDWDEPIPSSLLANWTEIYNNLQSVSTVKIPRCYFNDIRQTCNIHAFSDASMKAYGAAIYIQHGDQSQLVIAKSRIAPLKSLTIPKLELMGAVIASRLLKLVLETLKDSIKVQQTFLWTDSQIVHHWITNKNNRSLPIFVQNRVKEINSTSHEIRYCPTKDNPADLLTRGANTIDLQSNSLWWNGPKWIQADTHPIFPINSTAQSSTEETVIVNETVCETPLPGSGISTLINIENYNSLQKLLRVTAYALKFIKLIKQSKNSRDDPTLQASDIESAEMMWIRDVQAATLSPELTNAKIQNKRSLLVRQLRLFVDKNDILRCGGRIHNAPLSENTKFPILLPRKHKYTELVILDAHSRSLHSGTNATFTYIRQKYWIPKMRQAIRPLLRKCVTCNKVAGRPYQAPIKAPLPSFRINETNPFEVTGVDFTGALFVKNGTHEQKCYICLFTCAVTRAVHLELVSDLSTQTFMRCFRKFAARRSLPRTIVSDNGTTFIAADHELQKLFKSQEIKTFLANRGVEWIFIPKRAPWYGGFWERLIGMTKTAIKKVLGRAHITFDELATILTEIEAILNDRPLTYLPTNPDEPTPLTPSHLMHGRQLTSLPYELVERNDVLDPTYGSDPSQMQKREKRLSHLIQQFWTRWSSEYLPSLREHHKLQNGCLENTIRVGDIVQVFDENAPRAKWSLALVQQLEYGHDGLVRSAKIKTRSGDTNRPISKLYPLEVNQSNLRDDTQTNQHNEKSTPIQKPTPIQKSKPIEESIPLKRQSRKAATDAKSKILIDSFT